MKSLYDAHQERIQSKFKLDKLATSPVNNREKIDLTPNESADQRYYREFREKLKQRYGISELSVNSDVPVKVESTLMEIWEHDRIVHKNLKLCVAKYQDTNGKQANIWFSVTK